MLALLLAASLSAPPAGAPEQGFALKLRDMDRQQGVEGLAAFLDSRDIGKDAVAALDYLKERMRSKEDVRYGFIYAFTLERAGKGGAKPLLGSAALVFFSHFLWLEEDAARCADKTAPDAVLPAYARMVPRFARYHQALTRLEKQQVLKGLRAIHEQGARRPVNRWLCSRGMAGAKHSIEKGLTKEGQCGAKESAQKCVDVLPDPNYAPPAIPDKDWERARETIYNESVAFLRKH